MRKSIILFLIVLYATMACRNTAFPPEIKGNWLSATDSIEWVYSFQNGFAVFDNCFWYYRTVSKSKNKLRLVLQNEHQVKKLRIEIVDSTTLMVSEKGEAPLKYTNRKAIQPNFRNYDPEVFTEPILKDDTATIMGFIEDYSPELYPEKGTLHHLNIFSMDESSTDFKIEPDGRFFARFRIYHPQNVYLIIAGSTQTQLFIVPGERLTICLNNRLKDVTIDSQRWNDYRDWDINHYMGPTGMLSEELILLWDYYYYKRKPEPITKLNNMSLMRQLEYIDWRLNIYEDELESIDSLVSIMNHSAKAKQVMHLTALYDTQTHLHKYQINEGFMKHIGPRYVHKIPEADPDSELGLLVRDYMFYLNYLGIFQRLQIVAGLDQQVKIRLMNYLAGNIKDEDDLKTIRTWLAEYKDHNWTDFTITGYNDDKSYDSLLSITYRNYLRPASDIFVKYRELQTDSVILETRLQEFDFIINRFGQSLTGQLICVQILLQMLERDVLKQEFLDWAFGNITHPFLNNILHEKSQSKTEDPVLFSEYAPETHFIDLESHADNSDFFEEILSRFQGKVVYIDFWADWCAPCRAEFEPAARLKNDFEDKAVVFLYFGLNCRKERWENMIMQKQIEGYHYWLNSEQGQTLSERFGIRGVPHYLLFDKSGQMVEGEIPKPSNRFAVRGKIDSLLSI